MLEKIIIVIIRIGILLVIVGGLFYAGLYLWKHHNFLQGDKVTVVNNLANEADGLKDKETEKVNKINQHSTEDNNILETIGNKDKIKNEDKEGVAVEDDEDVSSEEDYVIPYIVKADCQDNCKNRLGKELEYKYCREICGFNTNDNNNNIEEEEEEDCDDIDDTFEEDICWKNKAIKESNIDYCKELYSEDLAKICRKSVLGN